MENCTLTTMIEMFLMHFLTLNFYFVSASQHGVSFSPDQHALNAIRAQITVDHSRHLSRNWTANTSICTWTGVSCGFQTQRVTALNLMGLGLVGRIPPQIGNLSFLTSLDFSHNSFYGSIPKEIGYLSKLQDLMLNNNQLTGSVPPTLFNQSSIRRIELSFNSLYGILPNNMCDQLVKLRLLFISGNKITGPIPSSINKCQQLRYLSMSMNKFNSSIPREIGNLTLLKKLYLGANDFQAGSIPLELGNLKRLEILKINNANLVGHVPQAIFNISSLKSLDFHNNSLSGLSLEDIYTNLQNLEELVLSDNLFSGPIPPGFWKLRRIRWLALGINNFTGIISPDVGNLTRLEWLFFNRNMFTGTIPNEIGYLDHLEDLSLRDNSFTGSFSFNISTLRLLDLSENSFSGCLPTDFGFLFPNLEELYIVSNKFQGIVPNSISNATQLSRISIVSNSFTGSIPVTIGRLEHLEVFVCGGNYFTNEGPELHFLLSLTNSRKLRILSFAQNPLNVFLPASFGNLSKSLQTFQAHECGIKGNIPIGIGNLTNLELLGLDYNELEGNIPTTLGKLQSIGQLFLENNKLQGHIPQQLCDLKNLGELYLSHNRLSGIIPSCLGDIGSLEWLFLDSNAFTSIIPSTLLKHKSLVVLNLSSNLLTGNLPTNISSSNSPLTGLDLSFNRISGDIPSSIGGFQMLNNLSLAHNKLQGSIPESLGTLISLEFLDLSQNDLIGLIPRSLEALRYLQYINLSYNSLQGEIPSGGAFSNFTASSFMHNKDLCGAKGLQVMSCRSKKHESRALSGLKYILPITASVIVLVVVAYLLKRRKKHIKVEQPSLHEWTRISYYELVRATKSFDESNLIGKGAYGSVFKGEFSDGVTVAIKVFNLLSEHAIKSFNVECEVLRNIRHRNLVKTISSCTNIDFRCLVMEYMSNGNLEQWLYSHNNHLNIVQRLQIMIDVASAIEYLHHGQTTPIIHCDLKPSNVLLDGEMSARVCDFGIAKIFGDDDFMRRTSTLGTIGYMAPEYGMEGIVSTGVDIYSFGILLLETLTRKKPTEVMFSDEISLRSWVLEATQRSVFEVVDENLINEQLYAEHESLSSIFNLAMDCTRDSSSQRINMQEAVVRLCKIQKNFLANN